MSYLSVYSPCTYEKVIERSRFIANCAHAESEEEARAFIAKIRSEHSLATHNCFAFIADSSGNMMRFSDDGEPQGTAGMPMLEVLKNKKLYQTVAVVTRYFGGIKLGAGGLVRAYSGTVSEALLQADIREYTPCRELSLTVAYENLDALKKFLASHECTVKVTSYAENVRVSVAVKAESEAGFTDGLHDYMAGRVKTEQGQEFLFPFPVAAKGE